MSLNSLIIEQFSNQLVFGGRHWLVTDYLDRLFSKFTDSNVDLVFFIDGFVRDDKYRTWSRRQNCKYSNHLKLIDVISKNELSPEDITSKSMYKSTLYNNGFMNVIEKSCMKFGRVIYSVTYECDKEAASFACANQSVLGIFSNDSDYLFFPGSWSYYSTKDIRVDSFTTKVYSRAKFRQHFGLFSLELPLFASIVGNDFITVESLKSFHKRMSARNRNCTLLVNIADFIKQYSVSLALKSYSKMIKDFAAMALGRSTRFEAELTKSIEFYQVDTKYQNYEKDEHLLNHRILTYNVLHGNPFNFSLIFFDLRQKDLGNYYDLAISMFQRQAGAVLKMSSIAIAKLKVRTKPSHNENYKEIEVDPVMPILDLPSIDKMQSDDPAYDQDRFNLLKWIIDWKKYQHVEIEKLPEKFVIDIFAITFLRQRNIITSKEADLLMWSVKNSRRRLIPESFESPDVLDSRAFRLSFLYVRMYANIERAFEVCGLTKRFGNPLSFAGAFFHSEYQTFRDKKFNTFLYLDEL